MDEITYFILDNIYKEPTSLHELNDLSKAKFPHRIDECSTIINHLRQHGYFAPPIERSKTYTEKAKVSEFGLKELIEETEKRKREKQEKDNQFEKLNFDLRISKFTYYTYWVAFAISIAAFIMSLISLLRT